jgi:hypothetical protein
VQSGRARVAWLAAVVVATAGAHARMPTGARHAEGRLVVPRPEYAKATALGFHAVVSDYYWLQAIQVIGRRNVTVPDAPLLARVLDVVTTVNPWVDHPYRFAAVWLVDSPESVRKANELLRRGIAHHPGDWRNWFYLGFNHFWYLDEPGEAAAALEQAMDLPGAPPYLRRLAARLNGDEGGLGVAESFLHGLILEAKNEQEREQYERALDEIATERVARVLDEARERHRERAGRDIEAVEDLVRGAAPALRALPPEPHGGRWVIDPHSGEIVSSVVGHRYGAKIDAVNRRRLVRFHAKSQGAASASGQEETGDR